MSGIKSLWEQLYEMECKGCGHTAINHTAEVGPCAECWRLCLTICEKFVPKDVEKAAAIIEGLFKEANPHARN